MIEDTLNPAAATGYSAYHFLDPFQVGLQASRAQAATAQSSVQYQDAHTLDRLVGTARGILREVHYDLDLPALAETVMSSVEDYTELLVEAGIHMAQAAKTFQDFGQGRQVNMAASDIRASAASYMVSSTNYTLETAVALLNTKQLIQQSAYSHVITDMHQVISRQSYQRSIGQVVQAEQVLTHALKYELATKEKQEQVGTFKLYADELTLTVGSDEPFATERGALQIYSDEVQLTSERTYLSTQTFNHKSSQYKAQAQDLHLLASSTYISATRMNVQGNTVRIGGGRVFIGGAVPRASAPIERTVTPQTPKTFQELPVYPTSPLLNTQEAQGIQMGEAQVVSPPQGAAGVHSTEAAQSTRRRPLNTSTYPEVEEPDNSINRRTL